MKKLTTLTPEQKDRMASFARRGMDKIRAAMGWTDRKDHP